MRSVFVLVVPIIVVLVVVTSFVKRFLGVNLNYTWGGFSQYVRRELTSFFHIRTLELSKRICEESPVISHMVSEI